ncbi:MAG: hypothetical protein JWM11_7043 [Planctomycetaceae bacterium]|nr:hypothetical protein [Planctomycetaceae bacterium]
MNIIKRIRLLPLAVILGVIVLVLGASRTAPRHSSDPPGLEVVPELDDAVSKIDNLFEQDWTKNKLQPAQLASDLLVLRRLSLALLGTIPSLEEVRQFEADLEPLKLERWTQRMLDDSRFGYYFSERLARSLVGTEQGQFLIFRRDRFSNWLKDCLNKRTPYDEMVRQMISETGLWTSVPATNFVAVAFANEALDQNKLAGRTVRAFLGQRIDCAQCHDHPFDHWKQGDFQGLAAFYGQVKNSLVGWQDFPDLEFQVENRKTKELETIAPAVPFHPEWLPAEGTRREKLAAWITNPDNRRFERATANRVWALMFGKPFLDPVDGLSDPPEGAPDLLDLLGADFRLHRYDLRRMIQVIAASKAYRLDSVHPSEDDAQVDELKSHWAVFPLIRLRPEQMIGAALQAVSLSTTDQNSHLAIRTIRLFQENDFVKEYGDLGENELTEQVGTIPQALLRMNGELVRGLVKSDFFKSSGRIANMAPDNESRVETAFLVVLSRRPTVVEQQYFVSQFEQSDVSQREVIMEDLFWSLCNSPEFSWNH